MRILLKPLQWIYVGYAVILFIALMLLIFPFVIISSFFGRIRGGNMIYRLCSLWADIWFPLIFIFHRKIYEAAHDPARQYIFVSNHISWLDAAILPKAFRQRVRALGKIEMSAIPIFGFIYRNAIVTVDRSSSEHRSHSIRILRSIISKEISVMVFPEGTFNKTGKPLKEFYNGAFRLAIETNTPIKPVLFLDSYSRMHYKSLFSLNPGMSRIVYLEEIPVADLNIADMHQLKQRVYEMMEASLIAHKASWIGSED